MDGLLGFLARACGREADFIGKVKSLPVENGGPREPNTDVNVSDPSGDTGGTRTQSESSIERNPETGTLCAAYNDSFHGVTQNAGFSGFARSVDGGDTWEDRGAVSNDDSGDPSMVWRRVDGKFYYAALRNGGLGLYRSDDDCQSFVFVSQIASGDDDKELMAIDNDPTSPFYGRIYIVWIDFGNGGRIFSTFSTDAGATWSTQLAISGAGEDVQGAWPTIAPNGDIYVSWLRWLPPGGFPNGDVEVPVVRSTNGGVSYSALAPAMTGQANPRDATASNAANCNRPAIKGNIRLLPSPQIVFRGGFLHAVYSYDPDGFNTGDVIDVFYRRYDPVGNTWGPEIRINDDGTTTDQYQPTLAVGAAGQVTVGYYSRQNDVANNLLFDYYSRTSFDNGASWTEPSVRLSDESSPVVLDGQLANCYHGDYDQQLQDEDGRAHYLWSDDRDGTPDIFTDRTLVGTNFLVVPTQPFAAVCAPDDASFGLNINQFQGFSEPVTLAASGNPAGSTVSFDNNTLAPPFTTTMTVTTAGVSAGTSTIAVTATSDPGGIVQNASVILDVFTAAPDAPALTAPADMATVVPLRPTFEWAAASQGANYVLEVADEPTFSSLLYTATVSGTSHVPSVDLPSNALLYWRVRSDNICGGGPDSAVFSFTTLPLPGDCPIGAFQNISYSTDFEGDNSAWTLGGGSVGSSNWAISTARPRSGANAFLAQDIPSVSDQRLLSPPFTLPSGEPPVSLIYFSDQTIEDGGAGCFDGGILEISTDNGATFTQIAGANMLTDPYDGTMDGGFSNPLAGLPAWCGDPQAYTRSVVDLTAFAGQEVRLRFRLGTDTSVGRSPLGWFIDDVSIQSCSGLLPEDLFSNGFE
jgi:hypothetical protein